VDSAEIRTYFCSSHLSANTPGQLVSAQGAITFSARYTPWGDTLQSSGTGNFTYGYLGGVMDTSTGLLYMAVDNIMTRKPDAS